MVRVARRCTPILLSLGLVVACAAEGTPKEAGREVATLVVPVDGSCARARPIGADGRPSGASARPPGDLDVYRTPLFVREARVRVRANAMWPSGDRRNVIGTIRGPRWVLGEGPLEDAALGAGVGYAVVVEGRDGERCRGYLSTRVLGVAVPPW